MCAALAGFFRNSARSGLFCNPTIRHGFTRRPLDSTILVNFLAKSYGKQKRVLICDNNQDHSFTLQSELRNHGYEVLLMNDATELKSTAASLHPDVVLAHPDANDFTEYVSCNAGLLLSLSILYLYIPL